LFNAWPVFNDSIGNLGEAPALAVNKLIFLKYFIMKGVLKMCLKFHVEWKIT
jgi:hypothetical protein